MVLPAPEGTMIEVNGEMIAVSEQRTLEYDNADIPMCIYWEITELLIPGTYTAVLFTEGYEIGSTTFDLE